MRGALGPGPNRMNRVVVSQTAAGLASYLLDSGLAGGPVGRLRRPAQLRRLRPGHRRDHGRRRIAEARRPPTRPPRWPLASALLLRRGRGGHGVAQLTTATRCTSGTGARRRPPTQTSRHGSPRFPGISSTRYPGRRPQRATSSLPPSRAACVLGAGGRSPGSELDLYAAAWSRCSGRARAVAVSGYPPPASSLSRPNRIPPSPPWRSPTQEPGADLALTQAKRIGADLVVANDPDADRCAVAVRSAANGGC